MEKLEFEKTLLEARMLELYKWMWPGRGFSSDDAKILIRYTVVDNELKKMKTLYKLKKNRF